MYNEKNAMFPVLEQFIIRTLNKSSNTDIIHIRYQSLDIIYIMPIRKRYLDYAMTESYYIKGERKQQTTENDVIRYTTKMQAYATCAY